MVSKEIMAAIEQFMRKVTVPVLYDTPEGLDQIGTGTLFEFGDRYFLVTARHIFDDRMPEYFAIPQNPIESDLQTLGRFDLLKPDDPADKEIDIAVLELLEGITIEHIKTGWTLLKPEHAAVASPQGVFLLCGYPSERIKVGGQRLGGSLITAYTERLPKVPENATQPVDERLDLFFRYDAEATDINGNVISAPHLGGTSGSSVWQYHDPDDGSFWTSESCLRIIGIQSSFNKDQFARAKSWEFVMAMLHKINPR